MKLSVPFYLQTTKLNCGPVALKMVLDYFGKNVSLKILEKRIGIKEGKGVFTIQIATAATLSGLKVDLFSKHIGFNDENLKLEFYQKYADLSLESQKLIETAKNAGVKIQEKSVKLNEILQRVNKRCIPIILLDWNIVKGLKGKGYQGHFVPIVGYDNKNIYVHNHGFHNPTAFLQIKKIVFEEARKVEGTDEDIIFIYR